MSGVHVRHLMSVSLKKRNQGKRNKAALALPVALSMSFALNPIVASAQTLPEETTAQPSADIDAVDAAATVASVEGLEVRLEVTNPRQDG